MATWDGWSLGGHHVIVVVIWLTRSMASDIDQYGRVKLHSSLTKSAIVTVAVLLVATLLVIAVYWLGIRPTIGTNSVPPVADTIPTTEPDEVTSEALIVLDGATRLRRDVGVYWSYHVAYALTENHLASNVIEQISSRLKARGWKPLQDDWLNPGLPSSHVRGWTDFFDRTMTPIRHVHQWSAQWRDESGNIVAYTLRYSYPESATPDLQSLWINGS